MTGIPAAVAGAPRIEHVIVLMLENRSFDHLLGFLKHPSPAFDGLWPGRFHNPDSTGAPVPVSDDGVPYGVDPDHSHEGALEQIGPAGDVEANGGFVRNYEARAGAGKGGAVMRCLDPAVHCPALGGLAREFAVCTAWFSSVPGETWPNRNFAHAATSSGTVNIEGGFYYDRTIFELLAKRKGRTWRIYYDGPPEVWCYPRLWRPTTILDFLLRRRSRIGNWFEAAQFADHVRTGDLATYTFMEPAHNTIHSPDDAPRRTNSEHPHNNGSSDADFRAGDMLVASVYETLRANPDLFEKTLLVVTYDEHGGLYDRAQPPACCPPGGRSWRGITRRIGAWLRARADRKAGRTPAKKFDFRQLGVRVPAVLVSPWIAPGTIVTDLLEHASIPRTLRELFAPASKPLTERDRSAGTFHRVVTESPLAGPRSSPGAPRADRLPALPDLSEMTRAEAIRAVRPEGAPADSVPVSPAPAPYAGGIDQELADLAAKVGQRLRRHPAIWAARRRAAKQGRPGTLAAPNGDLFPADHPVSLFRGSAKTARRRGVTRQPV